VLLGGLSTVATTPTLPVDKNFTGSGGIIVTLGDQRGIPLVI
jgi:hypothetical protein